MKPAHCCLLVVALLVVVSRAMETLAYHFVGELDSQTPIAECPSVEGPPVPTPFVAGGDELRDLTPSIRDAKMPIKDGWVLWNATRSLLIIHGAMTDQWSIANRLGFYRQDTKCKVNVEWLRTADANHPPVNDDAPFASLAVLTPSSRRGVASTSVKTPQGIWTFDADAGPWNTFYGVTETSLFTSVQGPGGRDGVYGAFGINFTQIDRKPRIVASWYAGKLGEAWWVRVTTDHLLSDGSSWLEARLRQVGEKSEPWPTTTPDHPNGVLPETKGGHVSIHWTSEDDIRTWAKRDAGEEDHTDPGSEDPFSGVQTGKPKSAPINLPQAMIPEWLRDIAAPPMADLRQLLINLGIKLADDDLVAYQQESGRLVYASRDPATLGLMKQAFARLCPGWSSEIEYQTWLEDSANPGAFLAKVSAAVRIGTKFSVEWMDSTSSTHISLEGDLCSEDGLKTKALTEFHGEMAGNAVTKLTWKDDSTRIIESNQPNLTPLQHLPDGRKIRRGQSVKVIPAVHP